MKFSRLKLSGFKSFVEATELLIEPGLTGIVGPNGCGKSNLLEALRWVMGENSYKNMRASGMDDVIFSGTNNRPARNVAEVLVTLDNSDRSAPPAFNDLETIEISRRIERDEGSAYRINGKEVRARDVQLLFADVSTGARSPALVKQGQISELINAKPQSRRRILEEAAGITGLHTRRHEAELKLKAAETNLQRLDDVTGQLEQQLNSLKRQGRQAQKYKQITSDLKRLEAAQLYMNWKAAAEMVAREQHQLDEVTRFLAEATRAVSEKSRERDAASEGLPGLREEETVRAAVVQRLTIERQNLEAEEARAKARKDEVEARLAQSKKDLTREQEMLAETEAMLGKLAEEESELSSLQGRDQELRAESATALQAAAASLAQAQEEADQANAELSELVARRNALSRSIEELKNRLARLERELGETQNRKQALIAEAGGEERQQVLSQAVEAAIAQATSSEANATEAETAVKAAREAEAQARSQYDEARRHAEGLATEVRTLSKLLNVANDELWPSLVDTLTVKPGYEAALGAALGDDIEAPADEAAPIHWRGLPPIDASILPPGAAPLSEFVSGPQALQRRFKFTGVVDRATGQALQNQLQPGQRLVSKEGDLWRWDGFTSAAEAPTAAARRLSERNRLQSLEVEAQEAASKTEGLKTQFDASRQGVEIAVKAEAQAREAWRAANSAVEFARRALSQHEREMAERLRQASALDEALRRIEEGLGEVRQALATAEGELAGMPETEGLAQKLQSLRDKVSAERGQYAEVRARHDGIERDAQARVQRLKAIGDERHSWSERTKRAQAQAQDLSQRIAGAEKELAELADIPAHMEDVRNKLLSSLSEAEAERRIAADKLAAAENQMREVDQLLRQAQELLANTREEHARAGARTEAASEKVQIAAQRIAEQMSCGPEQVLGLSGLDENELPGVEETERKIMQLRDERERLGGVNLRADDEAEEVQKQLSGLITERDDLIQAISKLRGGIQSLNKEGRVRLLEAFDKVNVSFGELFTTLFGGGKAELKLVESDDPLEAGLEIIANPPGKKPTTLSLLSGGEQALTAMALIFAVFLTNPSPICVLDEVDAPLDDHNVERFTSMLRAMLERADTRFLIITHHALTMAKMNRLFGVTMMERGVSQLVSVDLETAEQLVQENAA